MMATNEASSDLADHRPLPRPRLVLTVEQAAEALAIGRTLMYELVGTGAVESVRIGRLRRIPAQALAVYVESLRSTPGAAGVSHTDEAAAGRSGEAALGTTHASAPRGVDEKGACS